MFLGVSLVAQIVSIYLQLMRPVFDPWVEEIPWRKEWHPTSVFVPGEYMDREAWWTTVHGVTMNQTRLSD